MRFLLFFFLALILGTSLLSAQEVAQTMPIAKPDTRSFPRRVITRLGTAAALTAQSFLKGLNRHIAGDGKFNGKLHGEGRGSLYKLKGNIKWDGFVKSKFGVY
ncbi:hypothetical protein K493DRAFT_360712 [Basidiobolus meristosporus CBS 931.73]|uniref:Uncharacterized protein n=1 Tax=Basidiobolus meristosporus CBS 931.73 TaxID=1314790 RepID=A0A1Y1XGB2_9FUNG|nr:hypothetical protein K493DRAFT_360712 [Basidiobolus meristosporus CBS 931.73]|eukprot:ORX84414.1 hypothetical protein K493DRAFT_360712 [Basidiobolus meristosporus CBS 931.73]